MNTRPPTSTPGSGNGHTTRAAGGRASRDATEQRYRDNLAFDRWGWGSHCVDCYPSNCPYRVYVRDGVIVREEQAATFDVIEPGVPDMNPMGCQKGGSWSRLLYGGERILHPMRRAGERGEGRWQQISWDHALTEIAALPRMESRPDGALWMKLADQNFDMRVRDGLLHLRSEYAMIGYLNAPDPFDAEGWLNTGDAVQVDGDWIRVLGRASDLINIGGEKVFPAEVEEVLQRADNVLDATCFGEADPLLGSWPGADLVVRVAVSQIFVNCARYVHKYQRVRSSRYVPRSGCETPFAEWKRIDQVQEALPPRDAGRTAQAGGTITVEEYEAKLHAGES